MSDNTEEYNRYTQIAKERPVKVEKKKVEVWQLVFKVGDVVKEKVVSGAYSLCIFYKNKPEYKNDSRFKILPL